VSPIPRIDFGSRWDNRDRIVGGTDVKTRAARDEREIPSRGEKAENRCYRHPGSATTR